MGAAEPQQAFFDKIVNFRDVGLYTNVISLQPLLKTGLLYRSARLDAATERDRERLLEDFKIRTIIDLRTQTEHVESLREIDNCYIPPMLPASAAIDCVRIPGIEYKNINFNGSSYSNALIKQLTWSQTAKLFALYATGYRKEAISVLGKNVMAHRGLAGLAEDSLAHCTKEVKQVFDVLSNRSNYPLIILCSQGKDRTGLITLIVLMLMNVSTDVIEKDYMASEPELLPEKDKKLAEIRSIGLPDSFAECPEGWVSTVVEWIEGGYKGAERYLEHCGVGLEQQARLKGILRAGV
jgi:protein-tyrosine phosphatase